MKAKIGTIVLATLCAFIIGCGESSSSSSKAKNSSNEDGGALEEADTLAVQEADTLAEQNQVIFGVAQKGPFLKGGNVTLRELDGETLALTGKSFQGEISNDSGAFSIPGVTLETQYALLEANGNYWNENTARASNGSITLNALVDLSKSVNVNVNLLTHLEYERALYLATSGINVNDAKKQAEKEVFYAFGIAGDFANFEDLDILASGDGNTALLAISILMQGDISEVQLVQRLAEFAEDIEQDGIWDDTEAKTQIADWAYSAIPVLIRTSIKAMLASDSVPDFESIIKKFWWNIYGLGNCSAANPGEIKKNTDSLSAFFDVNFICDTGIVSWRRATAREYDTYQWTAESDGTIKEGDVSGTKYKYDDLQGLWLNVNELDTALDLNGCTQKREAEVGRGNDSIYYICRGGEWQMATVLEYDTYQWTAENDGFIREGIVTETKYKYDSLQGQWQNANAMDDTLGLNGCTRKREAEVGRSNNGVYYICNGGQWRRARVLEYDTYQKLCSNDAALVSGSVVEKNKYVCDADSFRTATASEEIVGRGCTSYNFGEEMLVGGYMECSESGTWDASRTVPGTMTDPRDGNRQYATIGIGTQIWMAENLNYKYKIKGVQYGNYCYKNNADSCVKYGRFYTWAAAMDSASTGCGWVPGAECRADTGRVRGVCPTGWHLPDTTEFQILFTITGGGSFATANTALRTTLGWRDNKNGSDLFGFSAYPSGYMDEDGTPLLEDYTPLSRTSVAYFWSSSEYTSTYAYHLKLQYNDIASPKAFREKGYGLTVRCVKD